MDVEQRCIRLGSLVGFDKLPVKNGSVVNVVSDRG